MFSSVHSGVGLAATCDVPGAPATRGVEVKPILTRDTSTDAYSRRVVPFGGSKDNIFTSSTSKPTKNYFWAHIMVSLWEIHIHITA